MKFCYICLFINKYCVLNPMWPSFGINTQLYPLEHQLLHVKVLKFIIVKQNGWILLLCIFNSYSKFAFYYKANTLLVLLESRLLL